MVEAKPSTVTGACHCRAVQIDLALPSEFAGRCHCQDCRRSHAAAFVTWTSLQNERLHWFQGAELETTCRSQEPVKSRFSSRVRHTSISRTAAKNRPNPRWFLQYRLNRMKARIMRTAC